MIGETARDGHFDYAVYTAGSIMISLSTICRPTRSSSGSGASLQISPLPDSSYAAWPAVTAVTCSIKGATPKNNLGRQASEGEIYSVSGSRLKRVRRVLPIKVLAYLLRAALR